MPTNKADRLDRLLIVLSILVPLLTGLATFYASAASAQDAPAKVTTVRAAGKTIECVHVTKALTVCTAK